MFSLDVIKMSIEKHYLIMVSPYYSYSFYLAVYAVLSDNSAEWINGVILQLHRESQPISKLINPFLKTDTLLLILSIGGIIGASFEKRLCNIIVGTSIFSILNSINYVSLFHFIPLLPPFCIGAAKVIQDLSNKSPRPRIKKLLLFIVVISLAIIGLINTLKMISNNVNSVSFQVINFLNQYLRSQNQNNYFVKNQTTIAVISNPIYYWIPKYIFDTIGDYKSIHNKTSLNNPRVLLVVDKGFMDTMARNDSHAKELKKLLQRHPNNC